MVLLLVFMQLTRDLFAIAKFLLLRVLVITLVIKFLLLRASATLKHVIAIGWTSVCPSVYPSVCHTLVLYQNGKTYFHAFFTTQ